MSSLFPERLIGSGSSGEVLLARDRDGNRVALKVLANSLPSALSLWENEVALLAKLKHHHLVRILGFSRDGREVSGHEGSPACWMEFIDGTSLSEAAKTASPKQIALWFRQALEALDYLHAQEVLHGDLKPTNILIDPVAGVKLIDFGFASLRPLWRNLDVRGSLPYLAPEAAQGDARPASDLFSLGTAFYEAFAGFHPRAAARDLFGLFAPCSRPLASLGLNLPPRTAKVVDRAIDADLAVRWKSAGEAVKALDQDRPQMKRGRPSPVESLHLFGRNSSRESIEHFIAARREIGPALILVHGPDGVGKTRFVREFYYDRALQGLPVEMMRVPEEGPLRPKEMTAGMRILTGAETLRPSQLDELSRFLRETASSDILILEYNDGRLSDDLQGVFQALSRSEGVLDVPLGNLSREDTTLLLRSLGRSRIDEKTVEEVYALTRGNPKLVSAFAQEDEASLKGKIPRSVEALFESRLRALDDDSLRVLGVIAAAEPGLVLRGLPEFPVSIEDVGALADLGDPAAKKILGRLLKSGMIRPSEADSFRFRIGHPILSGLVGRLVSEKSLSATHHAWISRLEARPESPETVTALAFHVSRIRTHPKRAEWILRAVEVLRSRSNEAGAISLLEKAIGLETTSEQQESLLRHLANAYGRRGEFAKSKEIIELWFRDYPSDVTGLNPVKYGLSTGIACQNLGDMKEAVRRFQFALDRADPASETHRPYVARLHSLLGRIAAESGEFEVAEKHFNDAMNLLPPFDGLRVEVYQHRALAAAKRGSWSETASELDLADRLTTELGDAKGRFAVLLERGNLALRTGRRREADQAYRGAYELATLAGDESGLARVHQNLGLLLARQGDPAQAIQEFERARELLIFFGSRAERAINLLELAWAQASVGNFAFSRKLQEEARVADNRSETVLKRGREVASLAGFLENGTPPKNLPAPEPGDPPEWDLERLWLRFSFGGSAPDGERLRALLSEIHRRLPDPFKIGFEERFDWKKWTTTNVPQKESDPMDNMQKMHAILRDLFASHDMSRILARIMDAAMDISKAERGFLIVPAAESSGPFPGFEVKVARNLSEETLEDEETLISLSAVRDVLKTGQSLVTDNAFQDPRFAGAQSVQKMGLKSILVLPLKGPQGLLGVIYLDHRFETQIFRGADLELLQMFADQAALALQKAKLIESLESSNKSLSHTVAEQTDELANLRREVGKEKLSYEYSEIVGRAPKMKEVLFLLDRLIDSSIPVWVFGESGTGKEMIARALHFKGPRRKKPFVSENCSALPEALLESELFGHKRGAFTHADRDKKGLLQYADGGTIFLDEIADTSPALQAKLLRFLQEKEFRPLGSNETVRVDVRIVSASNKDLGQLAKEGKFREDLFYRLNGVTVHLPPLRERLEDLPLLARHFLKKFAEGEKKPVPDITPDALDLLMKYLWPGNVRELENTLQTACLFAVKGRLITKSFQFKKALFEPTSESSPARPSAASASPAPSPAAPASTGLPEDTRRLLKALQENCYHKGLAAKQLGITRRYLYKKLVKLGIPVDRLELQTYVEKRGL